jgi:hypothetical protein
VAIFASSAITSSRVGAMKFSYAKGFFKVCRFGEKGKPVLTKRSKIKREY